ncbi:hypothetical protein BH24GEM2_BH24GEM2_09490 [soil metagenome]|jgi:phosphate/sulfate permease
MIGVIGGTTDYRRTILRGTGTTAAGSLAALILFAWVTTLPVAAALGAATFFLLQQIKPGL